MQNNSLIYQLITLLEELLDASLADQRNRSTYVRSLNGRFDAIDRAILEGIQKNSEKIDRNYAAATNDLPNLVSMVEKKIDLLLKRHGVAESPPEEEHSVKLTTLMSVGKVVLHWFVPVIAVLYAAAQAYLHAHP